jgi:chromosome segregation ATPase
MSKVGNRNLSKLDNVQLKQKIIHLQAELSQYKEIVVKYQNNYHYSQVDELTNEISTLKELLNQKERECTELEKVKSDMVAHVRELGEKNSELNDMYVELKEQIENLVNENKGIMEENEMLRLENSSLQKTLDHQEEEVMKLREIVEVTERERSIFNPKKSVIDVNQESGPTDSWFLRTIKQENKDNE